MRSRTQSSVSFNRGWTKKEFDSIFTREILEQRNLVLPVWYQVTKDLVYDYSPSLLNVIGLDRKGSGRKKCVGDFTELSLNESNSQLSVYSQEETVGAPPIS